VRTVLAIATLPTTACHRLIYIRGKILECLDSDGKPYRRIGCRSSVGIMACVVSAGTVASDSPHQDTRRARTVFHEAPHLLCR
jgi:hypothetical protein